MEKVINLKNDLIFRRSVEFDENKHVCGAPRYVIASLPVADRADGVKDAIFDAMLAGKLDATDIKIIQARDCSPMPSMREVARQLSVDEITIRRRLSHIKNILPKELQQNTR